METVSSKPDRRRRQRQAVIDEILDAARAQMRADGAAALNLNEVARQVGMRAPSLYEYFPGGKHAIYDALFALGFERFGAKVRALAGIEDAWEFLRRSIENYLEFALESPELFQICFERPVPGFVPSEASLAISFGLLAESRATSERVMARLGDLDGLTAARAQDLIIAIMHGIAALHLANEPELPAGEGRFGGLVPAVVALLRRAWSVEPGQASSIEGGHP